MPMSDSVSVITVNYNQPEATALLLDSLRRQAWQPVEVWVVDNGSTDNPEAFFRERYPEVHFIRSEVNLGFAGGNNLALPLATGNYLFFVNNDAELGEYTIETLLQVFRAHPRAALVGPMLCFPPMEKWTEDKIQYAGMTRIHPLTGRNRTLGRDAWNRGQFPVPQRTAYAHGAAMMTTRAVLEALGPMDEGFFLYYEELDWAERMHRAGWEVWMAPQAPAYHAESLTMRLQAPMKTYYLLRSRIRFMQRNYPGWQLLFFYLFLYTLVLPRQLIHYGLRGEKMQVKAVVKAILAQKWQPD
jgi:GT2 family glycosyltransferase